MSIVPEKNLLLISYYFPPMGGGGVQRVVKWLKYWDFSRFPVTVVTVKNSHFYAEDPELAREVPGQVVIHRAGSLDPFRLIFLLRKWMRRIPPATRQQRESNRTLRHISSFLFLPDSRVLWLPFALGKVFRLLHRKNVSIILSTVSPFTAGLVGAVARMLWGIPHVLDMRDAWTNNPFHMPSTRFHRWVQNKLEAFTLRHADAVIFVSPRLLDYYRGKYPFLSQKLLRVIRNGFDPADFENLAQPERYSGTAPFRIGLFGTIYSHGNWPTPLLQAVQNMLSKHPEFAGKIQLVFVGKWSDDFLHHLKSFSLKGVVHLEGYLPHRQMLQRAREMHALCISHDSRPTGSANITPGRIYEFLALQRPILALCHPESDIAHLIHQTESGEVVEYTHVQDIERILNEWLHNPQILTEKYRFRHLAQFDRRQQTAHLMQLLEELLIRNSSYSD